MERERAVGLTTHTQNFHSWKSLCEFRWASPSKEKSVMPLDVPSNTLLSAQPQEQSAALWWGSQVLKHSVDFN